MIDGGFADIENPFDVDTALMTGWISGTATIVTVMRTDTWVGRNEFFDVTIEVELPGLDAYELVQRQLIPEKSQFDWKAGTELGVLVNPADHSKAVLT